MWIVFQITVKLISFLFYFSIGKGAHSAKSLFWPWLHLIDILESKIQGLGRTLGLSHCIMGLNLQSAESRPIMRNSIPIWKLDSNFCKKLAKIFEFQSPTCMQSMFVHNICFEEKD